MDIDREGLANFFRINNSRFGKCLEPRMQCNQAPIRAHSIQNSQTIELLAENGHVIAIRPRFSAAGPEIEFKSVGRNEASTFTGLCSDHDSGLFKVIDTKPLDSSDSQQLFLIAYRSVTRELHATMDSTVKLQGAYQSRVERGLDSADEPSPAGRQAVQQMMLSWSTWKYREKFFDQPLLSENYGGITHDLITLDGQAPAIAVSSFFTIEDRNIADDLAGVVLNILPVNSDKTVAIFSYAAVDSGVARSSLDRILGGSGYYQKYELSKLVLSRTENFIISPPLVRLWSQEKAERIKNAFVQTITTGVEIEEHQDLMLFY